MSDWARRAGADALVPLAAILLLAPGPSRAGTGAPGPAAAPAAGTDSAGAVEGHPVARVEILTRNLFEPVPPGALAPLYRLANRLHVRTRPRTVREQLLFRPGEPWSEARGAESARTLRSLDYLELQRLEARRAGDSVEVIVETRDSWTTRPELNLERGGGEQFGTVGLTERNLLGLGKALSLAYHEDPTGISRSLSFTDPGVVGSRVRLRYAASSGAGGSSDYVSVALPFFAQDTRAAGGIAWWRSSSVARLFQNNAEVASHDRRVREIEGWAGRGVSRDGTILRFVGSVVVRDREFGPARLAPQAPPEFAGGEEDLRLRRAAGELILWRPRHITRRNVERIGAVEDFDLGPALGVQLGFSPRWLGSTADEGYARITADAGVETALGFGFVRSSASTRLRRGPREVVRRVDARWFVGSRSGHVLAFAARGVGGSKVPRDFQSVVGGLNGLRAYPVQALAGRELLRLNLEQRWVVASSYRNVLALGAAVFGDAARAWGPGAVGTGWFSVAGVGLRFASPKAAIGPLLRVDVAWPLSPTRDGGREAVFSFGSSQAF